MADFDVIWHLPFVDTKPNKNEPDFVALLCLVLGRGGGSVPCAREQDLALERTHVWWTDRQGKGLKMVEPTADSLDMCR